MDTPQNKPKNTGLVRVLKATGYSLKGLVSAFKSEAAIRQELGFLLVLCPVTFYFDISNLEQALLVASLFLILIVELVNSSIEAVVDRIGFEHHELSGKAKDVGSAAVFVAISNAIVVWGIVLL